MDQDLLLAIRAQLARYLNGKFSLQQFRQWFDVETWGVAAEGNSAGRQLAGEIELRLAEFTNGHLSENELRAALQAFLEREQAVNQASYKGSRR